MQSHKMQQNGRNVYCLVLLESTIEGLLKNIMNDWRRTQQNQQMQDGRTDMPMTSVPSQA